MSLACVARPRGAIALLAKDEALALAFPGADHVETRSFILTDDQKAAVEDLGKAPLESQLWTIHVGWKGGEVLGYAVIDSHVVRTMPETMMVVLDPKGTLRRVAAARLQRAAGVPADRALDRAVSRPHVSTTI